MKYQYRIHEVGSDFYPQVRFKKKFFWNRWSPWRKIVKRGAKYDVIDELKLSYPETLWKCNEIIKGFSIYIAKQESITPNRYFEVLV